MKTKTTRIKKHQSCPDTDWCLNNDIIKTGIERPCIKEKSHQKYKTCLPKELDEVGKNIKDIEPIDDKFERFEKGLESNEKEG